MSPLTTTAPATLEDTLYAQVTAAFAQEPRHAAMTAFRAIAAKHEVTPEGERAFVNAGCRVLLDNIGNESVKIGDLFKTLADTAAGSPALLNTVEAMGLCVNPELVAWAMPNEYRDTYTTRLANEHRRRTQAAATP